MFFNLAYIWSIGVYVGALVHILFILVKQFIIKTTTAYLSLIKMQVDCCLVFLYFIYLLLVLLGIGVVDKDNN